MSRPSHTGEVQLESTRIVILHLTKGLGPGGAERLIVNQIQTSADPHVEYFVGYVRPDKDHLVGEIADLGATVALLNKRTLPVALTSLVRQLQPDVIHAHSPVLAVLARILARVGAIRTPIVTTEHNRWPRHHPATRLANRFTASIDAARIAVSEDVRTSMSPAIASSTRVLDHGVPLSHVRAGASKRHQQRNELLGSKAADACVIGIVANFRPEKGYDTFLKAAKAVADANPNLHLVVVGQGPGEHDFRRAAASLEHVHVLGYRADAHDVMAAFDVFTLASRHEGKPVALMEAFALGLPVVATRAGGVPEAVDHNVNGLLVDIDDADALADAWIQISLDSDLRQRLAQAAAASADAFDAVGSTRSIEATYRSVVDSDTRS